MIFVCSRDEDRTLYFIMIEIDHVSKIYRRGEVEILALRELTCVVPSGRMVFIIGPSGSGKSSLLSLLGALELPTSGRLVVAGTQLHKLTEHERDQYRRHQVGFVFQSFNLISHLTAEENVLVPFVPVGVTPILRKRARELLEELGLGQRLQHKPAQLSGGEQQRVALARALLKRPQLILADEPTGELDSEHARDVMSRLRAVPRQQGSTVIVVTHELEYLQPGDHVVKLRDGRLISQEDLHQPLSPPHRSELPNSVGS
ncbi:MAG: putative ABC transporter ATP-binding protein [Planctomycetaceae bacterium]|nr:MAG: putative ABC transporter ATP-binding protein [Planctomycetaceae bacterium]